MKANQKGPVFTFRNKNTTRYGSFAKSRRETDLNIGEINAVGPGAYNAKLLSPSSNPGFSFGGKWNSSLDQSSDIPGPSTYRPEVVDIKANHKQSKGSAISKSERSFPEIKEIMKQVPNGKNYYKSSHFTSFTTKQSEIKNRLWAPDQKWLRCRKSK